MSPDGTEHEVDLHYKFRIDDIEYLTIVECKHWNKSVTRAMVQQLKAVREDLRAHKARLYTNNGYQQGAIDFAKKHGIGLLKLTRKQREVYAHFDGGYATIENFLKLESSEEKYVITETCDTIGVTYPTDESLANFLRLTFSAELCKILLGPDENIDWDAPRLTVPTEIMDEIMRVPNDWYKKFDLIESCGLSHHVETDSIIRKIAFKFSVLKFIGNRK
jgi:hypothetical protein